MKSGHAADVMGPPPVTLNGPSTRSAERDGREVRNSPPEAKECDLLVPLAKIWDADREV
jgi:hypothetical protein